MEDGREKKAPLRRSLFYPKREEGLRGPLSLRTLPWAREGSSESPVICPFPSFVMETSTHLVEFFQLLIQKIGNNFDSLLNQLDNQRSLSLPPNCVHQAG